MESIISAVISAIATIIAAWLSNRDSDSGSSASQDLSRSEPVTTDQESIQFSVATNTLWWAGVIVTFSVLLIYAGFFIHWDLPSLMGLFGIPIIAIILGLAKPTKPWTAASFVFGVATVSFTTEFLIKLSRGQSIELSSGDQLLPLWMFLIASLYASIAYFICWWRRR